MAAIDDLPPLGEVIRRHELMAKKSLGQNFLLDLNLTAKIARVGGDLAGVTVVEVGPGPGGLTRALLASGAARIVAVERDRRCMPALEEIAARYPGRLDVIAGDALETEWTAVLAGAGDRVRIIANLPYNIATPLLIGWLRAQPWPPWWDSMTLMFQKEVAAAHRRGGRRGCLWSPQRSCRVANPQRDRLRHSARRLHAAPEGDILARAFSAKARPPALPRGRPRAGDAGGVRPAAEDAAPEPEEPRAGRGCCHSGLRPRPEMRAEEVPVEGFVALANALDGPR